MIPVYFPFSFISSQHCNMLKTFFDQATLYMPMQRDLAPHEQGLVKAEIIKDIDDKEIKTLFKSYGSLSKNYKDFKFIKAQLKDQPFFGPDNPHNIRSQILGTKKPPAYDPLIAAGLFLAFAAENDAKLADIQDKLDKVGIMEKEMFKELKSIADTPTPYDQHEDLGAYMTSNRLSAWATIMQTSKNDSALYVTSSRAVMDAVKDKKNSLIKADVIREKLKEKDTDSRVSLKIYIALDQGPKRFFADFTDNAKDDVKDVFNNTVIGLIESEEN